MSNLTGIDGTSNPKDAKRVCARAEAGARGPCVRETSRQRRKAEISGAREFIKAGRNGKNTVMSKAVAQDILLLPCPAFGIMPLGNLL